LSLDGIQVRLIRLAIPAAVALAAAACDDPFRPIEWSAVPDTVLLYSSSFPEHIGRHSGFNFAPGPDGRGRRVRVEELGQSRQWDVVLANSANGFVFKPAGAFEGESPAAGITVMEPGETLESVVRAPQDADAYTRTAGIPLEPGRIYVVRTRPVASFIGTCRYFAKFEMVELNGAEGWAQFRYVVNPNCNDRALVPRD
jgi:hypothetical protein